MTEDEYRADLLATAASRAETVGCGLREAFMAEVLERLREAGELPEAETCPEQISGQNRRKLEIDAFSFDEADESLHMFVGIRDGGNIMPPTLTLSEARDHGFGRLLSVYEHARDGWLTATIEESRPLWDLARRIERTRKFTALRLHVVSDRCISERVREIPTDRTSDGTAVTFQVWDITRLKRIQEARSARDDLVIDFTDLPDGGLPVLPAAIGDGDYSGYLAVLPADALADIYIRYGSRLLEGNVRTFLGRRGNVNKGISATLAKEPEKFFAYNNGIAATAVEVTTARAPDGRLMITSASDLQIVNGAQTTASLASARREKSAALTGVFVPMKLSVVSADIAGQIIPRISRYANSQNAVRASDFFANHEFHRKLEEISRRVLAPAVGSSQVQTHWYYERARGQFLNDQSGLTAARKDQFLRLNPKRQVITKTDLAKVESCFSLLPDIACKGAEKSFMDFAERITKDWTEESARYAYGDDWFRAAVARIILFRTAERLVSEATWYEGGYRAQIVAYATARLSRLAAEHSGGGSLDWQRIWSSQAAGSELEQQLLAIAEIMADSLRNPPMAGQNISEWAKQQACRHRALESRVPVCEGFDRYLVGHEAKRAEKKTAITNGKIDEGLNVVRQVMTRSVPYWIKVQQFARDHRMMTADDEKSFFPALHGKIPTDRQAARIIAVLERCRESGFDV